MKYSDYGDSEPLLPKTDYGFELGVMDAEDRQYAEIKREQESLQGGGNNNDFTSNDIENVITRQQYEKFRNDLLNTLSTLTDELGNVQTFGAEFDNIVRYFTHLKNMEPDDEMEKT